MHVFKSRCSDQRRVLDGIRLFCCPAGRSRKPPPSCFGQRGHHSARLTYLSAVFLVRAARFLGAASVPAAFLREAAFLGAGAFSAAVPAFSVSAAGASAAFLVRQARRLGFSAAAGSAAFSSTACAGAGSASAGCASAGCASAGCAPAVCAPAVCACSAGAASTAAVWAFSASSALAVPLRSRTGAISQCWSSPPQGCPSPRYPRTCRWPRGC